MERKMEIPKLQDFFPKKKNFDNKISKPSVLKAGSSDKHSK